MRIPEPKFLLKNPKSEDATLILLIMRFSNTRIVFSTGEKIDPINWDPIGQKVIATKKHPEFGDINFNLDIIRKEAKSIFRGLIIDGITPTPKILKSELHKKFNKEYGSKRITLFQFINNYMDDVKNIHRKSTISTYKTTLNHLEDYCREKKIKLDFDDITLDFYYDFTEFLLTKYKFSNNTVGKYINKIKRFMNEAVERELTTNISFRSRRFKVKYEEAETIYLNEDELNKIYELDLSNNHRLDKARDLFLIGAYSGLRFSDFSQLHPDNIIKDKNGSFISIKTSKTGEKVVIPIHPIIESIFLKYKFQIPASISNQKLNEYIKEVGQKTKINDSIQISKSKGGLIVKRSYKKYDLITTHTARRSFATNMYLAGVPSISIMKITGHRTEKSFLKYIRISKEDNARKLLEHPFFQNRNSLKIVD